MEKLIFLSGRINCLRGGWSCYSTKNVVAARWCAIPFSSYCDGISNHLSWKMDREVWIYSVASTVS